jgi:DNA polymerase III epsilon subunit-like protein
MLFMINMPTNIPPCLANRDVCSDKIGAPLLQRDLCFIDVETTGPVCGFHEIVEIGAVRASSDAGTVRGELNIRLLARHPERLTEEAKRVNGYSHVEWVSDFNDDAAKWKQLVSFSNGCVPVCHNPSFDRAFLSLGALENGIAGLQVGHHWIGTESLAWPLFREGSLERFSLDGLCVFFGLGSEPEPHRALEGARRCLAVYLRLMALSSSAVQ